MKCVFQVLCLVLVAMVRGQGERVHVVDNANGVNVVDNVDPGFYRPTTGNSGLQTVNTDQFQPGSGLYNVDQGFYQPTYQQESGFPLYNLDQNFYQPTYQQDSGYPLYNVDQGFYQPTYQQGSGFPLYNVDQGFYQPSQPDSGFILQNVDQGFYRPTVGNPPNGGYQPISTGPAFVQTGPNQRPPGQYPYRPSVHPGARDGK